MDFDERQIIDLYQRKVYHLGLALTKNPADAEDFAQEVFLRLFRSADSFRGDCTLWTWIQTIARNVLRDRIGTLARVRSFLADRIAPASSDEDDQVNWIDRFPDPGGLDPEFLTLRGERRGLLLRLLEALPYQHRQILLLRDVNDLDFGEIMKLLSLRNETTVRVRLRRARMCLAREVVISLLQEAVEGSSQLDALAGYQRLINGWNAAIAVADTTGKYLTQNTMHSTLLGYSDSELKEITPKLLVGEPSSSLIEKTLRKSKVFTGKLFLLSKSGTQHQLSSSIFSVPNRSGAPLCQLWIHQAITLKEGETSL